MAQRTWFITGISSIGAAKRRHVRRSSDGADAHDRRSRVPQERRKERRIGVKLDMLRAELEAGKDMAFSTDYPGAGRAIL